MKKNEQFLLLVTVVASMAGLLFGYDTGVIGGSQLYFTEHFNFTSAEQGWAVSSALWGCLVGAGFAGVLSFKLGRKIALILSAGLFIVSAYGSGVPESLSELVVYRIIGGLGVGLASMIAPMYIAELAPANKRGRLVSYYQLAVVIGFFVVFVATYFIGGGNTAKMTAQQVQDLHAYNVHQGWRVMFWSELFPATSFLLLLFFVPNSPRWLVIKGRKEEALDVLIRINGEEEGKAVLREIQQSLIADARNKDVSVFSKSLLLILFIGVMLSVFQQVTGINAILYYGAEIFSNALGYGPEDALKQQLLLGGVNLIFTFVAIFTVDKWGRKPLLIVGTAGMAIGIGVLGLTIYFQNLGVLSLIGLLTFIGAFALSLGPVVWVMLSEMFPNRAREKMMSIAVGAQWLFNAIVANTFPVVNNSKVNEDLFSGALPYFIFSALCIVTIVFVLKLVPETKGKTLEEMEEVFK